MVLRPAIHTPPPPPPPGVCFCVHVCVCVLLITPLPQKAIAFHSSMRQKIGWWKLAHKYEKAPTSPSHGYATVPLKNSASGCSEKISAQPLIVSHNTHSFSLRHTLLVSTHPLKNPQTIHLRTVHKSPPTRLLLQGETFPRRGKKHLVVISFSFFTPLFPFAPFH